MQFSPHVRTRLAPTPSGYLHLGNAFSFALTAAMAKQSGAHILLRIDDLDRARVRRAYVEDVFATLDYLGIPWDEGPRNYAEYQATYSQIHRLGWYEHALGQLCEKGMVFACDCSRATLQANHPYGIYTGTCLHKGLPLNSLRCNWRLDTSLATLPLPMQYFVVRKKDGFPAYQLASLIDDLHFGVDLIVRGTDLWESTQAQLYLAQVLGYHTFQQAAFYHHMLLTEGSTAAKLSKSAGATSIQYLRKQGKTKQDIYGMIGQLLGLPHPLSGWEDLIDSYPFTAIG